MTFTKDTALLKHGMGPEWHVWISATWHDWAKAWAWQGMCEFAFRMQQSYCPATQYWLWNLVRTIFSDVTNFIAFIHIHSSNGNSISIFFYHKLQNFISDMEIPLSGSTKCLMIKSDNSLLCFLKASYIAVHDRTCVSWCSCGVSSPCFTLPLNTVTTMHWLWLIRRCCTFSLNKTSSWLLLNTFNM